MAKTVKELCTTDISQDEMGNFPESMYELSLIFDKRLKDILQAHENEISCAILNEQMEYDLLSAKIDEKDKEINFYKQQLELAYTLFINKNLRKELDEKQLYKENFDSWYQCDECKTLYDDNYCPSCMEWIDINEYTYVLKDNSNYDKLESKEE